MENSEGTGRQGRLVLIAEKKLSDESRSTLRTLLGHFWRQDDVTWVSGLSRASVLDAGRAMKGAFYNRDYLSPEQVVPLMPWREVWLVAAGMVWRLEG